MRFDFVGTINENIVALLLLMSLYLHAEIDKFCVILCSNLFFLLSASLLYWVEYLGDSLYQLTTIKHLILLWTISPNILFCHYVKNVNLINICSLLWVSVVCVHVYMCVMCVNMCIWCVCATAVCKKRLSYLLYVINRN